MVAVLVLPGCAEPLRVHVAPEALGQATVRWSERAGSLETHGAFGPNKVDTTYTFTGSGAGPPYRGQLLVVSLRALGGYTQEELKALARDGLEAGARAQNVTQLGPETGGARTIRDGVHTSWLWQEGTVVGPPGPAALFPQGAKVRLYAEVGSDGLSATSFYAVAFAQVAAMNCLIQCTTRTDERTWGSVVGDAAGSVSGARDLHGLVDNLVTHG